MTPSQQAKRMGLKSLTQVSKITGASLQTLTNWHRDKPELFKAVLAGCASLESESDKGRNITLKRNLDKTLREFLQDN